MVRIEALTMKEIQAHKCTALLLTITQLKLYNAFLAR